MTLADRVRDLAAEVQPADGQAAAQARDHQRTLAKPPGSLGALEELSARLAAMAARSPPPVPEQPALVIAAGDHGVHAQGVTPWPQAITRQMVEAFCAGRAAANALAATVRVQVTVLDVGVAVEPAPHPLLRSVRVRAGTADLTAGAAMSEEQAARALLAGAGVAEELVAAGADLLLTGDMGIANTTPSACLIAALTDTPPAAVTGRGAGIDDATLNRKRQTVTAALARHGPDRDPLHVLASLGGLEHAALVGLILAGAAEGLPVLLDGVAANAAALVAVALAPAALDYLIAGHRSVEPGAGVVLRQLDLRPLLDLELRLGEGTGALLAVPLVQAAARVLRDVASLTEVVGDAPVRAAAEAAHPTDAQAMRG